MLKSCLKHYQDLTAFGQKLFQYSACSWIYRRPSTLLYSTNMSEEGKENVPVEAKPNVQKAKNKKKQKESNPNQSKELDPWPQYINKRLQLYKSLKEESDQKLKERQENESKDIIITLPDGKTVPDRHFECDARLELLKFDDDEAKAVYWHSTAHVMGEAMERAYGGCLCYGPPIEEGFYYDMFIEDRQVSDKNDFPALEGIMRSILKEKQEFERLVVSKENLLEMFKYNQFKQRIINERITTPSTTVYRCGPLIDLCRGPHVRHTGKIKAFQLYKNSATYWEGKADAESLQRIYGISFPDKKDMKDWQKFQEEAKQRDHRKLGREQELFFFHELSPGSCFFFPKGAHIYNTLVEFIRSEYRKRGYTEVISPNIYNSKLWKTSGHWDHYQDNLFSFDVEKEIFALKPMNCPGHCLMFGQRTRSWRELPLRFADFGVLHRNELSGALTGLTRVRRFQQDDAHIFARHEQIKEEIKATLDFLRAVYDVFGFTFKLFLSTRPEKYLGELAMWDFAEKQLEESLNEFGQPWKLNPADGAFYGPKIDIQIMDAMRRPHQCATIQLDFQLPLRFNLTYVTGEGDEKKHPVIIHRAVLGSVERMIAILTENYGGKWPLWLSPRQVMVLAVSQKYDEYALKVKQALHDAGLEVDLEMDPGLTLNKKIRNAQVEHYNFILVVGEKEMNNDTVNVRTRDNKVHGEYSVADTVKRLVELKVSKCPNAEDEFGSSEKE